MLSLSTNLTPVVTEKKNQKECINFEHELWTDWKLLKHFEGPNQVVRAIKATFYCRLLLNTTTYTEHPILNKHW
jgi:hypothetical protein